MISLLEALTLTPMRASQFVDSSERKSRLGKAFENGFEKLRETYHHSLQVCLNHRWKVIGVALVFFVLSFFHCGFLKRRIPTSARSRLFDGANQQSTKVGHFFYR